jgi:hypothetical protein
VSWKTNKENVMELHFTEREISYLWHTAQTNFYWHQADRFDVKGDDMCPTQGGVLVWCGQEYLNAKIIAEHYRAQNELAWAEIKESFRTSIMWDEQEVEWVVWLNFRSIDDL